MIGEATLDPTQGDRRQKALQAALSRQTSAISRFARTGVGRGAVSGFGQRPVSAGGRPSGILNFLNRGGHDPNGFARGLSMFNGQSGGLGQLIAPSMLPSAPLPSSIPGSQPGAGVGGSELPPGFVPNSQTGYNQPGPSYVPDASGDTAAMTYTGGGQTLIPLGGGIFIDPISGTISGGGNNVTGLREGI